MAIDATTENVSDLQRRIVFLVDEGDKIKIESIRFTGNTVFGQTKLRYAISKTKQAHWWRFFDSKSTFNQAGYEEDVESLRKVYQDAGYKDVVIKDPILDVFVTNPKEKRREKINRRVRITIPIVEGEKFFFGKVTVEGSTVFRPEQLERFFAYKAGKPMSRAVIADGMKAIDAIYRSRGYIYVFMNPENTEKPNHVVDVVVKITEGDQYRLGRIEFTGNKTTRDKVLRRELQVFEGDIMDMETFKKSLFKVTQLGYFKIEEDPDFRVNPDKKTVDVSIKGTDTNRNEVQFGAGYSQLDGLFGQFQFNTRNFLGRGDTLGRPVPARQPVEFLRRLVRRAVVPRPADVDRRLDLQPDARLQRRRRRPRPEEQGREPLARLRAGDLRRRLDLLRVHRHAEHVPGLSAPAAARRRHRSRSRSRRTSARRRRSPPATGTTAGTIPSTRTAA